MVPFAGWSMPVQYRGVIDEHRAVRSSAGVFDVSHMGRFEVAGDDARQHLQRLLSNDLSLLSPGHAQYSLLTNETGGIVDDLIAYRRDDGYLLVVNAANRAVDLEHLRAGLPSGTALADESDATAMLALQGPASLALLAGLAEGTFDVESAPAFSWGTLDVAGVACTVARTGYTGEPGVELIAAAADAERLWDALIAAGAAPCGLGARDTLRLEVCYPLHGNDIGPSTNAIEAGLGWVCAREREFTGSDVLRRTRGRARATARRVPHARACDPARGLRDRRRGRRGRRAGDQRDDVAEPRRGHRHGVRADAARRAGNRDRDRRARTPLRRRDRAEAPLPQGVVRPRMPAESYPDDLLYHPEHDWARIEGDEATFGITWYAQDSLGDVVVFLPPTVGQQVTAGQEYGELESVKAVSASSRRSPARSSRSTRPSSARPSSSTRIPTAPAG